MLADMKLAPPVRELHQDVADTFKDTYLLDFFNLTEPHLEADLQAALLRNLRKFLLERGDGFAFVGEKVRIQVGTRDFELDLPHVCRLPHQQGTHALGVTGKHSTASHRWAEPDSPSGAGLHYPGFCPRPEEAQQCHGAVYLSGAG
jgi:hypothetical protein